jgi:hypothetical protein
MYNSIYKDENLKSTLLLFLATFSTLKNHYLLTPLVIGLAFQEFKGEWRLVYIRDLRELESTNNRNQ